MKRTKIFRLLESDSPVDKILIKGWVRTRRDSKGFSFIEVNDGSCLTNIQVIADHGLDNYDDILNLSTGSAVAVAGKLLTSKGKGQKWEIQADDIEIISIAPDSYPLAEKTYTATSFCVPSRTSDHEQTSMARHFASDQSCHTPYTNSSGKGHLPTSILPS